MTETFEVLPLGTKLKKGDKLWYKVEDGEEYGFYVKTAKVHATFGRGPNTPFGSKKGQTMIWIWNPSRLAMGPSPYYENVVIPHDKITKILRFRPKSAPPLNKTPWHSGKKHKGQTGRGHGH